MWTPRPLRFAAPLAGALALAACCALQPHPGAEEPPTPAEPAKVPADPKPPEPPVTALPAAPPSERTEVADTLHGVRVADPYRWLEPGDDPKTQAWVAAQDAFARQYLDPAAGRDWLVKRFTELFYVDAVSAPIHRGDRFFFTRRFKDKEKAILYVRDGAAGAERVLIDPLTLSKDGTTALGAWWPSRDGQYLAYTRHENNADEATLYVRDVTTGADLPDVLEGAKYAGLAWMPPAPIGKPATNVKPKPAGFFYVYLPSGPEIPVADRPGYAEVRWHTLGASQKDDAHIFPRTGSAQTFMGVNVSEDGHWMFLSIQNGWNSTDLYVKDLRKAQRTKPVREADLKGFDARQRAKKEAEARGFSVLAFGKDATTGAIAHEDRFFLVTNDGAPRYRVYRVDAKKLAPKDWTEIIPEGPDPIEAVELAGGQLLVQKLVNAAAKLEVRDLDGKLVRDIALPSIGSVTALVGEPTDDEAYYAFTSFTQPTETYKMSVKTGASSVWAKIEVPFDASNVVVEQVFYPSKDGTKISMFIVHQKGIALDGSHPTLLYGYGGFNQNMTPAFASSVAVWVQLGGVYAMPNLRGGGEYGEAWHRAGMLDKKQNVFDDFAAAAEYLVHQGYTTSAKLAIRGGSNGGLLVGAAMTQRPDLFRAVICAVPLLDMVRYHLFGSGATWVPEYGSAADPAQFATLHAYSPYHQVRGGTRYPALLMMGSDHDDRVDPMHARKFVAEVQHAVRGVADRRVTLFRLEKNAGHGGADMVKKNVESYADQFAFLMHELGVAAPK